MQTLTNQPPLPEGSDENKPSEFQYVMECTGPNLGTKYFGPTLANSRQEAFNVLIVDANSAGYSESECKIV